jgi:sec-independent protein translocase protein TatC
VSFLKKLLIANALALILLLSIGLYFSLDIARFLVSLVGELQVVSVNPVNSFMALMETGVLAGVILYAPIGIASLLYYVWSALYNEEKSFILKSVISGSILFILGVLTGVLVYTKFVIPFFITLNTSIGVTSLWDYGNLLTTILTVAFGTGLIFLFPIPLRYVINKGWVKREVLAKQRPKVAVILLGIIIVCPFTPMDIMGQLILFLPLYLLFEISIFDGFGLLGRKKEKEE